MLTYLTDVGNEIPNISNLIKKLKTNSNWQQNCYWSRSWCIYYDWTIIIRKLTSENFTTRLIQANLASKSDIANFIKKTDFDNKLKNVRSNKNELIKLSKKVKAISTKGLTKDLMNKLSIPNGAKYFSSGTFQNYLVFIPVKKYIKWHYWGWFVEI